VTLSNSQMPPKRKRCRNADACLTRAENKKKANNTRRTDEIQTWRKFLATARCRKCDVWYHPQLPFQDPTRAQGCSCPSHSSNRWLWLQDENGMVILKKIVFCSPIHAVVDAGSQLDSVCHRIYRAFWKAGKRCEVSSSLIEMTYWTRQMEKGTPLYAALHHLLKQLLHETGVCDFVFSFLAFPA
jgi:hypothetical protein